VLPVWPTWSFSTPHWTTCTFSTVAAEFRHHLFYIVQGLAWEQSNPVESSCWISWSISSNKSFRLDVLLEVRNNSQTCLTSNISEHWNGLAPFSNNPKLFIYFFKEGQKPSVGGVFYWMEAQPTHLCWCHDTGHHPHQIIGKYLKIGSIKTVTTGLVDFSVNKK